MSGLLWTGFAIIGAFALLVIIHAVRRGRRAASDIHNRILSMDASERAQRQAEKQARRQKGLK